MPSKEMVDMVSKYLENFLFNFNLFSVSKDISSTTKL